MSRATLASILCALLSACATSEPPEVLPAGVEQILPRGGIPAIVEPEFVTAAEADIDSEAWVLGVAIGDQARAYSLNLLNRHEIVNDRISEMPIAAVW